MTDVAWLTWPFLIFYLCCLVVITIFCFLQFHLWVVYITKRRKVLPEKGFGLFEAPELPFITIQLPVFNEMYVVERVIDAVMKMDYPKDRYEVQVLDDSTDNTLEITMRKALEYNELGHNISVLHRTERTGYKAGALQEGLKSAKGEFIAIFDADFIPEPGFLKATIHHFKNLEIGVVQTRWGHINEYYSLLTSVQAFQLNVHFTIEQFGRYLAGYFLQFNGTAGIWRKSCIEGAGGWHADTLTEDLDLSYRAQLKGWKILFREDVVTPAELPVGIHALKSQQYRWMKGGAETARKLFTSIMQAPHKPLVKLHALNHVLASSIFIFVWALSISSLILAWSIPHQTVFSQIPSFLFFPYPLVFICLIYFTANYKSSSQSMDWVSQILRFIFIFPVFLAMSMAIAFHNTIAVLQGFFGKKTSFVRTPKYGDLTVHKKKLSGNSYTRGQIGWITVCEVLLLGLFTASCLHSFRIESYDFTLFHMMLALGYCTLLFYTFTDYNAGPERK
jgi:cellulose synthase/poly-beta-1,6-N-acetylglucosamine synthase-like glycosyltransferase